MNWKGISCSNLGRRLTHGWRQALLLSRSGPTETEHRKVPWPVAQVSSSASYSAWNAMRFHPTRSRRQGEPVLWTYRCENGPREAGEGEMARAVFNGSGDGVRRRSVSKDSSNGDGVGGGSSSKRRIGAGVFGTTARRQRCGSAMASRFQPNSHGIEHYL
jgi:hypothetical protein